MNRLLFVLFISVLITACNQSTKTAENPNQLILDSLTNELTEIQKEGKINGFGVAIVNEDKVMYQHGFGFANVENDVKYTDKTIQNIASISKTFIGISLLKAQEMGKLNLDDDVSKYLPFEVKNPHFPNTKITIRHLTTHTSTITDGDTYDEKAYCLKPNQDLDTSKIFIPEEANPASAKTDMGTFLKDFLSEDGQFYSKEHFIKKSPGEWFDYTNVGATLAAYVIELATEMPYNEFVAKHILQPLKMESSGLTFDEIDFSKHSTMYAKADKPFPFYSLITYPDGGMLTSANDMSLYLKELIRGYFGNGTLLTKESYEELFKPQLSDKNFEERNAENPYNDEYNMGVFMGMSAQNYVGHTGGDPGVSSLMFFSNETKIGRYLVINTDITDEETYNQFINIWNVLRAYQDKL